MALLPFAKRKYRVLMAFSSVPSKIHRFHQIWDQNPYHFVYFPLILGPKSLPYGCEKPHFPTIVGQNGRESPTIWVGKDLFFPPITQKNASRRKRSHHMVGTFSPPNGGEIKPDASKMVGKKWQCYGSRDFPPILRGLGGKKDLGLPTIIWGGKTIYAPTSDHTGFPRAILKY